MTVFNFQEHLATGLLKRSNKFWQKKKKKKKEKGVSVEMRKYCGSKISYGKKDVPWNNTILVFIFLKAELNLSACSIFFSEETWCLA